MDSILLNLLGGGVFGLLIMLGGVCISIMKYHNAKARYYEGHHSDCRRDERL